MTGKGERAREWLVGLMGEVTGGLLLEFCRATTGHILSLWAYVGCFGVQGAGGDNGEGTWISALKMTTVTHNKDWTDTGRTEFKGTQTWIWLIGVELLQKTNLPTTLTISFFCSQPPAPPQAISNLKIKSFSCAWAQLFQGISAGTASPCLQPTSLESEQRWAVWELKNSPCFRLYPCPG